MAVSARAITAESDRTRGRRALASSHPTVRVPELLLGVLLVAGCALGAVLWQRSAASTRPALVLAHDVRRGDELSIGDFASADVSATGARLVPFEDVDRFVGRVAVADLSAFTPVTDDLVVAATPLRAGERLVGLRLEAGEYPAGLAPGDRVGVILVGTPSVPGEQAEIEELGATESGSDDSDVGGGGVDAGADVKAAIVIETIDRLDTSIDVVVTLRVPDALAGRIGAAADVRLTRVGG